MTTLSSINLQQLMAEDLEIWVTKDKKFGYKVEIENEKGEEIVNECNVHPYAMDSFADFCRNFIAFYDKVKNKEAA